MSPHREPGEAEPDPPPAKEWRLREWAASDSAPGVGPAAWMLLCCFSILSMYAVGWWLFCFVAWEMPRPWLNLRLLVLDLALWVVLLLAMFERVEVEP